MSMIELAVEQTTRTECGHCGGACSWYLDGGIEEDPEMFAYVLTPDPERQEPTDSERVE